MLYDVDIEASSSVLVMLCYAMLKYSGYRTIKLPSSYFTVAAKFMVPSRIDYLSMVIYIYISISAIGPFKMSVPFRAEILA